MSPVRRILMKKVVSDPSKISAQAGKRRERRAARHEHGEIMRMYAVVLLSLVVSTELSADTVRLNPFVSIELPPEFSIVTIHSALRCINI